MRWQLILVLALFPLGNAAANLCGSVTDLKVSSDTKKEMRFYKSLFPNADYIGSNEYNSFVLECNRKRDANGGKLKKMLTKSDWAYVRTLLNKPDLPAHFLKFNYRFFGLAPFKMRYGVWKEKGVWHVLLPYRHKIKETVKGRIDFHKDHAKQLYERSQVESLGGGLYEPKTGGSNVWTTLCQTTTYVDGKEGKYDGMDGDDAYKRDRGNKHISLGYIEYTYKKSGKKRSGCRVNRNVHLYGINPRNGKFEKIKPVNWMLNNFIKVSQDYWSQLENFQLHIAIRDYNEKTLPAKVQSVIKSKLKRKGDYLAIQFGSTFMANNSNQMYKSNIWQPNNFSTMTTDGTYTHEVGHALGLDDEYAMKKASKTKKHCANSQYKDHAKSENNLKTGSRTYTIARYTMCEGYGVQDNSIYQYIAVSRYALGEICKKDNDCGKGRYCNNRLGVNRCLADGTKAINQSCIKNRECRSKACQKSGKKKLCSCKADSDCPKGGQCFKPLGKRNYCKGTSAKLGASCTKNAQCRSNKCESKKCVCNADSDCPNGGQCFRPLGKPNYCKGTGGKLGASCTKSTQCRSNKCESKTCVCNADSDCPNGKECKRPLGKKNYCSGKATGNKKLGAKCKKNKECGSNKCESKVCVCKSDSDCASGKVCFTPVGKKNYCGSAAKSLGASCKKNKECRSNKCESKVCVCKSDSDCASGKVCFTPLGKKNYCGSAAKALGASCKKNKECRSNKCQKKKCVCARNSDCPSGKKCKKKAFSANYCK